MSQFVFARRIKLVAVSGAPGYPSKTETLVNAIVKQLQTKVDIDVEFIRLSQIGHLLSGEYQYRNTLPEELLHVLEQIESADALLVASPVYRSSYTGLFKHLFDLVDQMALVEKPVLLAATGGSERHALVIEHHLRPLFSFFQANTLPIGVYGTDKDFSNYQIHCDLLKARIDLAVDRALPQLVLASHIVAATSLELGPA